MEMSLTCLLCAGSAIWIAEIVRRLASSRSGAPPAYGTPRTAAEAFRAFQRLFAAREATFLKEYPRVATRLNRRLSQNRRIVFQTYLEHLRDEHAAGASELRGLAVELDRPELARESLQRQFRFKSCYWLLRLQLATGLPVTPRVMGWAAMPQAQPAPALETARAHAELERTAVR